MRRIAVRRLIIDGQVLDRQVLELEGRHLLRYYPLIEEQAQTEWTPKTVTVIGNIVQQLPS